MAGRRGLVRAGFWFTVSGALTLMRAAVELTEPVYYDPSSLIDDAAVLLTSAASAALAVALYSWWRTTPFSWRSIILLPAVIGLAAESLGNLLEDGFDSDLGGEMYNSGGLIGAVVLLVTGVVALATGGSQRWSGLFLLAGLGGAIFPDDGGLWLTGASFTGLGIWMIRLAPHERVSDEVIR